MHTQGDDLVTYANHAVDDSAKPVLRLLLQAQEHFARNLSHSDQAQAYLRGRGIEPRVARRYGLGYAQASWRDLGALLRDHDDATVLASGLLVCAGANADAHRFDRFRNRVMFPIRDRSGAVVGFGGRFLGEGAHAKYLNSPESEVFRKRELLYGLYEARDAIDKGADAVIVEGYLDVLAAQQAGLDGAVGSLGTACTAAQLEALFGAGARRVIFCFDGDAAGRQAAERALATVLPLATEGRSIAFAMLPEGHDPDSLVREAGPRELQAALAVAKPLRVTLVEQLARGCDLRWPEGRGRFAALAADAWRQMPAGTERDWLEARVRDVLQTGEPWVREYLEGQPRATGAIGAHGGVRRTYGRPLERCRAWGRTDALAA